MNARRIFAGLALLSLILTAATSQAARNPSWLIGAWRLVSFKINWPDGRITDNYHKAAGQIIYTADGRMGVHLVDLEPTPCQPSNTSDCNNPQARGQYADHAGYWGRYELAADSKSIKHYVEHSIVRRPAPTASNTPTIVLTRTVQRTGNRLILTTPPQKRDDQDVTLTLEWEKIK